MYDPYKGDSNGDWYKSESYDETISNVLRANGWDEYDLDDAMSGTLLDD